MRYRFILLVLISSLTACTFQVNVLTPEQAAPAAQTATPSVSAVQPSSATPLALPTFTSAPTLVPSPVPDNLGTYPIKFEPNGTSIDIVDTILMGTSKTYSISALQGQIMSVSVHQPEEGNWTVIPMTIVGADNTVLCPSKENADCYVWRGVLPSTQDYFVKLTPFVDVLNFTLHVAINPPGVANQSFHYVSKNQRADLSYSDEFAPVRSDSPVNKIKPELVLQYINTSAYTDTNLLEAYFMFGSSDDASIVASCTQPASLGGPETVSGEVNINGVTFTRSEATGVGAGNIYEQSYYRVAHQGVCYEVTFLIHSGSIGAYAPELGIKEFDRAALIQKFQSILSTLVIK